MWEKGDRTRRTKTAASDVTGSLARRAGGLSPALCSDTCSLCHVLVALPLWGSNSKGDTEQRLVGEPPHLGPCCSLGRTRVVWRDLRGCGRHLGRAGPCHVVRACVSIQCAHARPLDFPKSMVSPSCHFPREAGSQLHRVKGEGRLRAASSGFLSLSAKM